MADRWDTVLDRLEADLAAVERGLGESHPPTEAAVMAAQLGTWVPPRGLGPLPDHLIDRARALAATQARVAERVDALRITVGHHLTALRALPSTPPQAPRFVDVEG
ncbi:hypothetical protein [Terracoccus sp. 273MFTsu3.1]|uniref:hypothetical protein n=1 Tax=Terracoccus sp. 273MFTsu3.1 TaxID=1172188 RepID=UPI0012DF8488|nr:hypothetical protein [Terracoccus sp. 273MFTsu3.1]